MFKIMVVAGEVSGDMQAARVIRVLKKKRSDLSFIGMGGKEMLKEGVKILFDPTQLSTIGFVEALKHLRKFYQLLDMLSRVIDEEKPDLLFLVDYSGFNMKMAKIGQKKGVPVVNYFSPSAWVWGEWRAYKMAKWGAKIAAVFPMEVDVYKKAGADVTFVGHPLLDFVSPTMSSEEFRNFLGLKETDPIIGLLPGSRKGEILSLLPPMIEAARLIHKRMPQIRFVLPLASPVFKDLVTSIIKDAANELPLYLTIGHAYEVMDNAELILCASGTATLEAACLKVPMIIAYKTSLSTYFLGKLLAKVKFVGLPNIIAGKEIVPEFLQRNVTGENLARAAFEILENRAKKEEIEDELAKVRTALGAKGAVERVADLILRTLEENTAGEK
ncbi:lipid-A-disaccharide synthase [Anoxybacter fermentans]|uniref:Lipid-A-disaccharide synthase n=1 Tax=Anoxybacter fermentans TaxID=1323375 RepID=A0A3S9T063_9FIRM|nr:lipid-A-disaccharide synthase [Anoxybacter fermentans]AZR73948.1 lipid-A-disaccharide synthase [Anoxybacter fermentans]